MGAFSLGCSFATPNSMIMILSVAPSEAIPYTGFSQISFVMIAYGGSLWMNYCGESWGGSAANYANSFAIIFTVFAVANLIPLTVYTYLELKVWGDEKLHMNPERRSTIKRQTSMKLSEVLSFDDVNGDNRDSYVSEVEKARKQRETSGSESNNAPPAIRDSLQATCESRKKSSLKIA